MVQRLLMLYYGQIRPCNYKALRSHYGHEPPWPMDCAPHVSLVEAVLVGTDPRATPYFRYLLGHHGEDADDVLARQVGVVGRLLDAPSLVVEVEHESVLDGNHRTAVCLVTGKPLRTNPHAPYQTVEFPNHTVEGRRFGDRRISDYDFRGKRVLDLGCNAGMLSIHALQAGASEVVAVDQDLRSTTWQLRDAWGFQDKMSIVVSKIEDLQPVDADVVLAFSVVAHADPTSFAMLVSGRDCILETHISGEEPPPTGHEWTRISTSRYSRELPNLQRDIYLGRAT